ncbi:glutaredoxin [Sphingobium sufflavum]|uniref:glutaredoxin n=1 Tax=Sphingobium sufflavum TaxID=1129547 RepID=UPI001F453A6C|nr:glutaredoxin [Sphingobium sufflavum]MCE7798147.1 glutaredoxin [Sphingobium sufflavum]
MADDKTATLYRMVLPDHVCPYGVAAKQMLDDHGFTTDEHILKSREEVDAFEAEQGVDTTPQIMIDGKRIGGCDDLEEYLAQSGTA